MRQASLVQLCVSLLREVEGPSSSEVDVFFAKRVHIKAVSADGEAVADQQHMALVHHEEDAHPASTDHRMLPQWVRRRSPPFPGHIPAEQADARVSQVGAPRTRSEAGHNRLM
eukprot:scaffold889_cov268-Pinguiococcus_pyrenoidosus.AAC.5